jgi:hypothetical protein
LEEKVLLDRDYAHVSYNRQLKLGKIIWRRKPVSEEYKLAFHTLLDYAAVEPVEFFLSDMNHQGVISAEDRSWFKSEMLPMAVKSGLKRAAVFFDGNIFVKYYLNLLIISSSKSGLPLRIFQTEEKAIDWLFGKKEMNL